MKKKPLPIYLLPERYDELKTLAYSRGVTMTALVSGLINKELRKSK